MLIEGRAISAITAGGPLAVARREADSVMVAGIVAVGAYLVLGALGVDLDIASVAAAAHKYLGASLPLFAAALAFLLWVSGALLVEVTGLAETPRQWGGVDAALFYVENAAPFVGLLECFISIVKALLAYSAAGVNVSAQSTLIANIAIALGASAVGCFVALCAHSLKALLAHRMDPA